MDGATLIQSHNYFEPANPQKHLDDVSHINHFFKLREEMMDKITKMMIIRFDLQQDHEVEIKEKIKEQQFWKNTQAWGSKFTLGVTAGIAGIIAGLVNESVANFFRGVSQLAPSAGDLIYHVVDGKNLRPQTELQQLLNTESLDKQKQEQMRNLSKELQNIVMEIIRNELQMFQRVSLQ